MQIALEYTLDEAGGAAALAALIANAHGSITGTDSGAANAKVTVNGAAETNPQPHEKKYDVIRLYDHMAENQSPRFLEALTDHPLTFAELSARMASDGGAGHEVASMRAIYRNVRRREKSLIEAGIIGDHVVQTDFSGYDEENAGRYYLDSEEFEVLQQYLKK